MTSIWYAIIGKLESFYHPNFMGSRELYSKMLNDIKDTGGEIVAVRENISREEISDLIVDVDKLTDDLNKKSDVNLEEELRNLKFTLSQERSTQAN